MADLTDLCEVEARLPTTEADVLGVERTSDAAMLAASESIAGTVEELSRNADAARLLRSKAEAHDAAAIAACVAETAAAFEAGNEAAALRAAWLASKSAEAAAAKVVAGAEGRAAAVASRVAGHVAERVEERAAFDRRRAKRAEAAATADVARVAATVDQADAAIEFTSHIQELALARIAADTAVEVAINAD